MTIVRKALVVSALVAFVIGFSNYVVTAKNDNGNDNSIDVVDECLPGDPGWDPTGGCMLKPNQGDVSFAEFNALLVSSLTNPPGGFLMGHPAWRNVPSHLTTPEGKSIKVTNRGGRRHTFTEVAEFGGGFVPPLNIGLSQAPECLGGQPVNLDPGQRIKLTATGPGLHKFQCCIHPWMKATVRVE